MKMEERSVPVKPTMPTLDKTAVPLSQPQLSVPALKAPTKRVPAQTIQTVAPGALLKPVQAKPMMQAPKQMHRAIQAPKFSRMPPRSQVEIKSNNRPSQPAKPLQQRPYIQGNASQRPTYPGFNAPPAPSLKGKSPQMYRYVPPNHSNYNFPMMPQWDRGYNYSYPMMPYYNYLVRPNGQQDENFQQSKNGMQKNTKTTPVENRKK